MSSEFIEKFGGVGAAWADWENDLIVADYFSMMTKYLGNQPYVKAHHNKALRQHINRSKGAVERKHQNISAVFEMLGMPWLKGYVPLRSYQKVLIDAVERQLNHQLLLAQVPNPALPGLREDPAVFIGPAPQGNTHAALSPDNPAHGPMLRLIRKFDPAARDARNRALGRRGEEWALHLERARLTHAGRDDLANKVRWVAQEDGDGAGYDILSFSHQGRERFLEVKTTTGHSRTPFFISSNEKLFAEENPDRFEICRVHQFAELPRAFTLKPPLENHLILHPANYRAHLR